MILDGRLKPGDRLPREADLAVQLGISRSSLREAVRALSLIRILDVRRGDGTYVTSLTPEILLETMAFIIDVHQDSSILDLFEVRRALEPMAAEKAALLMPDEDAADLLKHVDALEATMSMEEVVANDLEFHHRIAEASGNAVLCSFIDGVSGRTQRARVWRGLTQQDAIGQTRREHHAIASAIAQRQPSVAAAARSYTSLGSRDRCAGAWWSRTPFSKYAPDSQVRWLVDERRHLAWSGRGEGAKEPSRYADSRSRAGAGPSGRPEAQAPSPWHSQSRQGLGEECGTRGIDSLNSVAYWLATSRTIQRWFFLLTSHGKPPIRGSAESDVRHWLKLTLRILTLLSTDFSNVNFCAGDPVQGADLISVSAGIGSPSGLFIYAVTESSAHVPVDCSLKLTVPSLLWTTVNVFEGREPTVGVTVTTSAGSAYAADVDRVMAHAARGIANSAMARRRGVERLETVRLRNGTLSNSFELRTHCSPGPAAGLPRWHPSGLLRHQRIPRATAV